MRIEKGFTLAEVLITLLIVGVVAALTIPTLLISINNKVKAHKILVFERKFNKGTGLLAIQNGIGPYYDSTQDFVEALSEHIKIIKMCSKEKIYECIPYKNVLKTDGTTKSISNYLSIDGTGVGQYTNYGEVMGVVFGDGTPMLLSWNKDCLAIDPDTPNQNTSSCISGWYDINGSRKPNRWGKDIIGFNYGFGKVFVPNPITKQKCEELKTSLGIKSCYDNSDYWAGAVKQCGGIDNMPTYNDLDYIAKLLIVDGKWSDNAQYIRNSLFGTTARVGLWVHRNILPNINGICIIQD